MANLWTRLMEDKILINRLFVRHMDADQTFSDDPLRMLRAIRFATQLNFFIRPEVLEAIQRNVHRLEIISQERITTEVNKIIMSSKPSVDTNSCSVQDY